MRKNLYSILDVKDDESYLSKVYNIGNILLILMSILPLLTHQQTKMLWTIEVIAIVFFVIDYLLRFITADIKFEHKKPIFAFLTYPFTPYAIIDMLAILPFLTVLNPSLRLFRLFRLSRSFRIFRTFRMFRYSKSFTLLKRTVVKQKDSLILVGGLTLAYIFIAALLVFNIEPETFPTFLEALYWSTASVTTVAYGDTYPISLTGQLFSMLSYIVGVIIIALPTSVITAGYIEEIEREKESRLNSNEFYKEEEK